jgi:ubiquinone/menaquinone biosynthesis C-methylase UbiE
MTENISLEKQISSIWNSIKGFHIVHFIKTGSDLDLFNTIINSGKEGINPKELAKNKNLSYSYIDKWCNSGVAWKILDIIQNDRIILAPHMNAILTKKGDPRYLLPYIQACINHFGPDMENHASYYKNGKTYKFQEHSHNFSVNIGDITEGLQTLITSKIIPNLDDINHILNNGGTLLDFGCGTGNLLLKASNIYKTAIFYGLDIDKNGLETANKSIVSLGKKNKITFFDGNGPVQPKENSIDVITMVEVFHEIDKKIREKVLKDLFKILKPNGTLIILDETMPEKSNLRDQAGLLAILTQYNEMTWGNEVPTLKEQNKLIKNAGFNDPIRKIIGGLFTLLIAKKI